MRPQTKLTINKEVVYALFIVIILVFGLFFLNKYFDISASTFTVREHSKNMKTPGFFENIDKNLEDVTDTSETFKNNISP